MNEEEQNERLLLQPKEQLLIDIDTVDDVFDVYCFL